MSIYISNNAYLASLPQDIPNRAIIGYKSILTINDITASGTVFNPENMWSPDTYMKARFGPSAASPALTFQRNVIMANPANAPVDYVGLFGHQFGSLGFSVKVQQSTNGGSTWTDITDAAVPPDDGPIVWFFDETQAGHVRIHARKLATSIPETTITHVRMGQLLRLERPMFQGQRPPIVSNARGVDPRSDSGNYFSPVVTSEYKNWSINQTNNSPAYVRTHIVPFIAHMNNLRPDDGYPKGSFFYVPRPEDYPQEVVYAAKPLNQAVEPENSGPRDYMSWSCSGEAFV